MPQFVTFLAGLASLEASTFCAVPGLALNTFAIDFLKSLFARNTFLGSSAFLAEIVTGPTLPVVQVVRIGAGNTGIINTTQAGLVAVFLY